MARRKRREKATDNTSPVRVFVAHSSKDSKVSEKIAKALRRSGFQVWYDKWSIKVGESISQKIEQGVEQGDFLVVVLSNNSVSSQWVRKELSMAMVIELEKRSIFILPALIDGCEIPISIRDKKYADFRRNFDRGLDELLDSMGAPSPITVSESGIRVRIPPRESNIRSLVESMATLSEEELRTETANLAFERREKVIVEIMDKLSMAEYYEVPSLTYLFRIMDLVIRESGRPSVKLFETLFREFTYHSLPVSRDEVLRLIAKYTVISDIRGWIQNQGLTDWFVSEFVRSPTFSLGGINSEIVANLQPLLSKKQIEQIAEASVTNNQIFQSWGAPSHLRRLFALSAKWISSDRKTTLRKLGLF